MSKTLRRSLLSIAFTLILTAPAMATDGYFASGFGVKQQGQGGAGVALPQDSLAAATNPAGMVFVGNRFDFGLTLFRPIRSGTITGNQLPPGYPNVNGTYDGSRLKNFGIPELGFNRLFSPRLSLGVSLYGNGGMNTSYFTPIPLLGSTKAGVDLQQLFVSPTLAFKVNSHNGIGVSLNIGYQRFAASGLENFANANYSLDPGRVTNRGYDSSEGVGVRVGWLGELTRIVSVGATYQSKTYMGKFNQYQGLFAERGGFDIPANFAGGVAVKVHPKVTALLDVERILYGGVRSIANSDSNQAPLGSANGPGFGWHDLTSEKVGLAFQVNHALTLRGGYNHSGEPFDGSQTFFNLLAPAVVQNHVTVGATWSLQNGKEINVNYLHAFGATVNGSSSIPPNAGGGNANLNMYQDSVGVSFGWSRK
jgi:long-chain fatty acid transport protein